MSDDDDVGYGKPPRHTRFEKGRSGNPKGRPKGGRNKGSVIRSIIDRKVTVRENGRKRRVTVFEALVESMTAKALRGSINDQIKLLQLIEKHAPEKLRDGRAEDHRVIVEFVDPPDHHTLIDGSQWKDVPRGGSATGSGEGGGQAYDGGHKHRASEEEAAWQASGLADDDNEPSER